MTKIDTTTLGSYDALNKKIDELRTNLQNMAVAGQAGTPAFNDIKNEYVAATNQMKEANREVTNALGLDLEQVASTIRQDLATALTTPLREGETAFQRFGNIALNTLSMIGQQIIANLLKEISLNEILLGIKTAIAFLSGGTSLAVGDFGATDTLASFAAKGNAYVGGQELTAYANGGVVSSPTLFPMKNGTGLMGEAGAEAIMPLKRTSNGRLGVEATGQSQSNINIYNQSQSQIETVTRPNGETDLFIRKVNNALASERTQSGFTRASGRQNSRGITAA